MEIFFSAKDFFNKLFQVRNIQKLSLTLVAVLLVELFIDAVFAIRLQKFTLVVQYVMMIINAKDMQSTKINHVKLLQLQIVHRIAKDPIKKQILKSLITIVDVL